MPTTPDTDTKSTASDDDNEEEDSDFQQITTEITSTLSDLAAPTNILLSDFTVEYEKLARALNGAHDNEKRVENKCKTLVNDTLAIKQKARNDAAEQDELHERKLHLTKEIETAWKGVKKAHEKSTARRKKVVVIRNKNDALLEQIALGSGWTKEQKTVLNNYRRKEKELEMKLKKEEKLYEALVQEVKNLILHMQQEEEVRTLAEQDVVVLLSQIHGKEQETTQEQEGYNTLTSMLDDKRIQVEALNDKLKRVQGKVEEGNNGIHVLEQKLISAKKQMEGYLEKYDVLFHESKAITFSLDGQMSKNVNETNHITTLKTQISGKKNEKIVVKKSIVKILKLIGVANKRLTNIEGMLHKSELKRNKLVTAIERLREDKEHVKKEVDHTKNMNDGLVREKLILTSDSGSVSDRIAKMNLVYKVNNNGRKNYEIEISSFISQARTQREIIEKLEIDVTKYNQEAKDIYNLYYSTLEEVKYNNIKVVEIQRKILESNSRLKQQQNLYEQVRSERNLYSKNLVAAKNNIQVMKQLFKTMNHDINQMKDEITVKDHSLVKEHFDHHKVEKKKIKIKNELTKIRKQIESSQQIQNSQLIEISKLNSIIQEAEEERQRQKKELNAVVGERDILTRYVCTLFFCFGGYCCGGWWSCHLFEHRSNQ